MFKYSLANIWFKLRSVSPALTVGKKEANTMHANLSHGEVSDSWKTEWMKLWRLEAKWQWTAACCWGSQIPYSTVAPWLMSVVSVPLDTRLLLCGLIQPHAIKQKSHCMQGWGEPRVSSILPSRLSSPPRLSGVHALLSSHRGTQHTHHREPQGLRCLEVNRIA